MKTQELNEKELREINGGSIFGSSDGSSNSGLAGGLGIGNLLSFSNSSTDGDRSQSSSFSLGNNIGVSLQQLSNSIFN